MPETPSVSFLPKKLRTTDPVFVFAARLENPIWVFDLDHKRVLWANTGALRIWAADSLEELIKRDMGADMSESVAKRLAQYRHDFIHADVSFCETWSIYPKGVPITLRVMHSGIVLEDGRMAMLCDGQEQKIADNDTLRSAESLLHTPVMITLFSRDGKALYRNPAAREDVSAVEETFAERFTDQQEYANLIRQLSEKPSVRQVTLVNTKNGKRWHELSIRTCRDAATGDQAWLISEVDVSELKRAEARALHLASHDVLTELPNRKYVMEHFPIALEQARYKQQQAALLLLDLDDFKYINESVGHAVGDALLIEVARRLQTVNPENVLARLSGDQFLVLLVAENSRTRSESFCTKVLKTLKIPYALMGHSVSSPPSIGIALYPQDGNDLAALMKHADLAMAHAKNSGGGTYVYYQPEFGQALSSKNMEKIELKNALDQHEFTIYLQPRIDVHSDEVVGAEALVRWIHPEQGVVPPDLFIPACERLGLISELGLRVFEMAALQQKKYEQEGRLLTISVNLSPIQLDEANFVEKIKHILEQTGCTPQYMELEITESALLDDSVRAGEIFGQLRALGLKLFIDDFGTGYSNFRYLQRYALDGLKVDRSFINTPLEQRALAAMIIMMSKAMGLRVIAEGVETDEQLKWLKEQDCDEFQGYLISRPLALNAFEDFMRTA